MRFSHDTELTLRAACVLVNSNRVDGERLGDLAALDAYLDGFGWTGRRDRDAAELESVHRLRDRLAEIWAVAADEEQVVAKVNA
ncbi:MAG: ABATE domain-containing protein, partial [Mycolicibacterium hassiacum]